jgi:hypothetical protein
MKKRQIPLLPRFAFRRSESASTARLIFARVSFPLTSEKSPMDNLRKLIAVGIGLAGTLALWFWNGFGEWISLVRLTRTRTAGHTQQSVGAARSVH